MFFYLLTPSPTRTRSKTGNQDEVSPKCTNNLIVLLFNFPFLVDGYAYRISKGANQHNEKVCNFLGVHSSPYSLSPKIAKLETQMLTYLMLVGRTQLYWNYFDTIISPCNMEKICTLSHVDHNTTIIIGDFSSFIQDYPKENIIGTKKCIPLSLLSPLLRFRGVKEGEEIISRRTPITAPKRREKCVKWKTARDQEGKSKQKNWFWTRIKGFQTRPLR